MQIFMNKKVSLILKFFRQYNVGRMPGYGHAGNNEAFARQVAILLPAFYRGYVGLYAYRLTGWLG